MDNHLKELIDKGVNLVNEEVEKVKDTTEEDVQDMNLDTQIKDIAHRVYESLMDTWSEAIEREMSEVCAVSEMDFVDEVAEEVLNLIRKKVD